MSSICDVCPRHCKLSEGQIGYCRSREAKDGQVICQNYGRITGLALDPIEKKPFYHFHPGKLILSVGSYGCNMSCFYCQNHDISQADDTIGYTQVNPKELVDRALQLVPQNNIGLAFTYNEPAVGWEFVRDTAEIAKRVDLSTAMVTNGCFSKIVLDELLSVIDAFNIDLKCFSYEGYESLGGDLATVKSNIERVATKCHVEVTTLIVPGQSDDEALMESQAIWLAELSPDIPLHLSRYFPRWKSKIPMTSEKVLLSLADIARKHLNHVYIGNIRQI